MGRVMDGAQSGSQEPSVSAVDNGKAGGEGIRPQHVSSPSCWCGPIEVEPGVWLHHPLPTALPLIDREPWVEGYVPDIKGHIEGDDT